MKTTKTLFLTISIVMSYVFAFGVSTAQAASNSSNSPVGFWKTIDDETGKVKSIVQIRKKNGKLSGKVVKLFRKPPQEMHPICNKCTDYRKDKPILGMTILWDLEQDDDEWSGGWITDPNKGKTYSCYIAVENGGKKLKVRGYLGLALLGRTQYWHKVAKPEMTPDKKQTPAKAVKPAPANK